MRLTFFGAAGEVTGSCYLLETGSARVLFDFGMHQGSALAEKRNRRFPPMHPDALDAAVLTHAHLDHCGRLPLLPRHGYSGDIHATPATCELTGVILRDSAAIQEMDAERINRRRLRRGARPIPPLYTTPEAEIVLRQLSPLPYGEPREVAHGVTIRFFDAGHILGSASVEVRVRRGGADYLIAFSGDIGPHGVPLLRDPEPVPQAHTVILESTYGDRRHPPPGESIRALHVLLAQAAIERGKVLIPAFAVGRTQQIVYHLAGFSRERTLPVARVVVDSPMAVEATDLYRRHRGELDADTWALINGGHKVLEFPELRFTRTAAESEALNRVTEPIVIISASGMCTGGRILHHLKHSLWKDTTHMVFVGFQAEGTIGRRIADGARVVRVMGEPIAVAAKVHTLDGFSAHADADGLVAWATSVKGRASPPRFILTHGEHKQRAALADRLAHELHAPTLSPTWGETLELV